MFTVMQNLGLGLLKLSEQVECNIQHLLKVINGVDQSPEGLIWRKCAILVT